MRTVTKKQLTDRIADAVGVRRTVVKTVVQRFLDEVVAELAMGNRLEFRDFGVFEVRVRKPRMAQNPRTLERVPVPVKSTVKFKVGRRMKERIQQKSGAPAAKAEPTAEAEARSSAASRAPSPPGS